MKNTTPEGFEEVPHSEVKGGDGPWVRAKPDLYELCSELVSINHAGPEWIRPDEALQIRKEILKAIGAKP